MHTYPSLHSYPHPPSDFITYVPSCALCSVHASWNAYFSNMDAGVDPVFSYAAPPGLAGSTGGAKGSPQHSAPQIAAGAGLRSDSLGVSHLINAFQTRGHEMANLDPLNIHGFRDTSGAPELHHEFHGFSEADLDRKLNLLGTSSGGNTGFLDILAGTLRVCAYASTQHKGHKGKRNSL